MKNKPLLLVENRNQKCVDYALVDIIKIVVGIVQIGGKIHAHETPMPWFVNIICVVLRVRKNKTVFVRVLHQPLVCAALRELIG